MQAVLEFKPNDYFEQRLFVAKNPCYSEGLEKEITEYFTKLFNGKGSVYVLYDSVDITGGMTGDVDVYVAGQICNFYFKVVGNAENL